MIITITITLEYCGLQNNRPKDDEKIFEKIFRGRKDAEKTVERSFCARKSRRKIFLPGLSGEKSVFLPFEKIFRGLFPTDKGTLIPDEISFEYSYIHTAVQALLG